VNFSRSTLLSGIVLTLLSSTVIAADSPGYAPATNQDSEISSYQYTLNLLGKPVQFTIPLAAGPLDRNGLPFASRIGQQQLAESTHPTP
jgi:hypothetical protein